MCCKDVVELSRRGEDGEAPCHQPLISRLLSQGPSQEEYDREKWRLRKVQPKDDSYEGCTPAQRRLILYGCLHKLLYARAAKGQRDIMPSCIKQAVREAQQDGGRQQQVKGEERRS